MAAGKAVIADGDTVLGVGNDATGAVLDMLRRTALSWMPEPRSLPDGSFEVSIWWVRYRIAQLCLQGYLPEHLRLAMASMAIFGPHVDPCEALVTEQDLALMRRAWGDVSSAERVEPEELVEDLERFGFMTRVPSEDPEAIVFRPSGVWRSGGPS